MDLSRLPREELEGFDRRAVESDLKKYLENFFEKWLQLLVLLLLMKSNLRIRRLTVTSTRMI